LRASLQLSYLAHLHRIDDLVSVKCAIEEILKAKKRMERFTGRSSRLDQKLALSLPKLVCKKVGCLYLHHSLSNASSVFVILYVSTGLEDRMWKRSFHCLSFDQTALVRTTVFKNEINIVR
jgi:hypothetical protein